MGKIPYTLVPDSTLSLLFEGYNFIQNRCDRYQTDIFQTRFLLQNTICFRGKEAAQVFYDTEKFTRKNAAPERVKNTLLGKGGVQGLDGETHRQRKQIFMALMTPEHMEQLVNLVHQHCRTYAQRWQTMDNVILFDEMEEILCRAVCAWSGVPLLESDVSQRTQDMSKMIAGSGRTGLIHWQAKKARQRAEMWIEDIIQQIRSGQIDCPEGTAAYAFAWHQNSDGKQLELRAATVDLLNVLRPTVAIGRYITFAALALHQHPECRQSLQQNLPEYTHWFTQEVRRFYPFFPFASACTRHEFDWHGYHFPAHTRVLLDLYGTNRDPNLWEDPEKFWPERFQHRTDHAFDFIPQGGGDYYTNHRCAGEWLTLRVMDRVLKFLVSELEYCVPAQDLHVNLAKIPTHPESRFIISKVNLNAAAVTNQAT